MTAGEDQEKLGHRVISPPFDGFPFRCMHGGGGCASGPVLGRGGGMANDVDNCIP